MKNDNVAVVKGLVFLLRIVERWIISFNYKTKRKGFLHSLDFKSFTTTVVNQKVWNCSFSQGRRASECHRVFSCYRPTRHVIRGLDAVECESNGTRARRADPRVEWMRLVELEWVRWADKAAAAAAVEEQVHERNQRTISINNPYQQSVSQRKGVHLQSSPMSR